MTLAQLYADFGWAVFRLPTLSKIPAAKSQGFKDATKNTKVISDWATPYNVAVATGYWSGIFVVDIDPSSGGEQSFQRLCLEHDDLPSTVEQTTPRGGRHLFFKYPANTYIHNDQSGKLGAGVDVRGQGGYVLIPDSKLKNGVYEWVTDQNPFEYDIADAPEWLLELIAEKKHEKFKLPEGNIERGSQDDMMFKFACSLRSGNMSDSLIEAAIRTALSKCPQDPNKPFTDNDIKRWLKSSGKYHETGEAVTWDRTKDGGLRKTLRNTLNFLHIDENLAGLYCLNLLSKNIEYSRKPAWGKYGDNIIDDSQVIALRVYLGKKGYDITKVQAFDALINKAEINCYHPVIDYLNSCQWDKVDRVSNWLSYYLGADDNEYTRFIGQMTLVAACARVDKPGVKYDHMLILEGDQGIGKSQAVEALNPPWFCEISLIDRDKDTIGKMLGHWILEVPELEVFKKRDVESLKSFLTTQTDKYRVPYDIITQPFARQCIFIGTINPDNQGIFVDITGNRRFLPVAVNNIRVGELRRDRNALWAEAWRLYKQGSPLYINNKEIAVMANCEQKARLIKDDWMLVISDWIESPHCQDKVHVKGVDIWQKCLHGMLDKYARREQLRISRAMMQLGYEPNYIYYENGFRSRCYYSKERDLHSKSDDIKWDE